MSVALAQPITGVSANREAEIEVIYPSVAAGALGRLIGVIMGIANAVPITFLRLLTAVILGIPMSLLGVVAYAMAKVFGNCYVLTNRSVSSRSILGGRTQKSVALSDIARIEINLLESGYAFHRVGDILLENAQGQVLLSLTAVSYPYRVRQIILDAQSARMLNDESLAQIQRRK